MDQDSHQESPTRTDTALAVFIRLGSHAEVMDFDAKLQRRDFRGVGEIAYGVVRQVSEEHAAELRSWYESAALAALVQLVDKGEAVSAEELETLDHDAAMLSGLLLIRFGNGAPPSGRKLGSRMADLVRDAIAAGAPIPRSTLDFFERRGFTLGELIDIAGPADRSAADLIAVSAACSADPIGVA